MFSFASIGSWIVYNYLSAVMVSRIRKKLESEFSTIESTNNLKWLIFLIVFYNLYCALSFLFAILNISLPESEITQYIYNYSTLLILIYILGFYGLRQKRIFVEENDTTTDIPKEKYSKSLLSKKKKENIKTSVISFVEESEAYLNPDISMTWLSKNTNIPKHQITEVFNTELGKNFFQFINEYRIEEVKKMLSDPHNKYSIEAIGYDCGFSSKSSFFSVFKKITGLTPSQYRIKVSEQ